MSFGIFDLIIFFYAKHNFSLYFLSIWCFWQFRALDHCVLCFYCLYFEHLGKHVLFLGMREFLFEKLDLVFVGIDFALGVRKWGRCLILSYVREWHSLSFWLYYLVILSFIFNLIIVFKLFCFYSGCCSSSSSACTRSKWICNGITWCHYCRWWVLSVSECHNYHTYELGERESVCVYVCVYIWVPRILQHFICWCIGLAWGTGTSIAHRAMDALMGPRVIKHETVASSASDVPQAPNTNGVGSSTVCADQSKALIDVWFSSSYHLVYEIYIYIYII